MSDQRPKPVNYDELFPGRFLKAGQLKGRPVTLRIKDVDVEPLPDDKGKDRVRGVLSFERTDVQLVLNSTNGQCIRHMFGVKVREWIGKRVTFVPEKDKFGRETVDCIRIAGSPDLERDMTIEIKLPRRKPKKRKLSKTGAAPSQPDLADHDEHGDPPPEECYE